ncbi:MAG: HAMP domain-containing sensor histidine kinase, partial [Pseudolabrys sp.]
LLLVADSSRQAATVAIRILGGEKPGEIHAPPVQFASPMFDWREMQRWGIGESQLPAKSRIYFRNPTLWSQYRWQIALIAAVILTEALLIAGLLYERRRRRLAEVVSFRRMAELAHLNRVATAGELSASIAHEVRQPLAAMVAQSGAAQRWLAQRSPNLDEARAALKKIIVAGDRASQIVENLRSVFRKQSGARKSLDINAMVENVLALTSRESREHGIVVQTSFSGAPTTLGEQAQLEQVFLNLVINAIEAMSSSTGGQRILEMTTAVNASGEVLVTIADTGPGVEEEALEKMFDAFYTTKPEGMGMGLPICRSIVESHGGRLWVSRRDRGLSFHVTLPGLNA